MGQALQLTVLDMRAVKDRPSTLELAGQPADVASFMPLVLINPQVTPLGDPVTGPEGCLSFPEVYADITRPESVNVAALNEAGEGIEFKAGGLLARAIQHEADHLNGILFIDRMSAEAKNELKPQLESLQSASKAALLSLGQALRAYLGDKGVQVMTVMPTTIDTDMSKGADVPKMTTEFVAGEILRHIREETIDPPIGEEAEGILDGLLKDPLAMEKMFAQIRAV